MIWSSRSGDVQFKLTYLETNYICNDDTYTLYPQEEDGLAVRADWVGRGNQGYISSSRNIVRTFMVIRQVGWK